MTSITTIVKHRVRTTGSEHQGYNSISNPDQNLGFTGIFSSGVQEDSYYLMAQRNLTDKQVNDNNGLSNNDE